MLPFYCNGRGSGKHDTKSWKGPPKNARETVAFRKGWTNFFIRQGCQGFFPEEIRKTGSP